MSQDDQPHRSGDRAKPADETSEGQHGKKPANKRRGPPWYKRPGIMLVVLVVGITAVVAIALIWRHSRTYETTDDAYIDVVSQQVSPQISGRVTRVLVNDNQDVRAGQVLVQLDAADYRARLDQALASKAQAEAQLAEAGAQGVVYGAQLEEARASLGTAQANATNADHQLTRYRRLKAVNPGAVSDEQMDNAVAAGTSSDAQLNAARKSVLAAEAQIGYAHSLEIAARAGIRSAESSVREAQLTLSYTDIKARVDGRVASKTVSEGNVLAAGAALMAIVPREVYITANFKETQLRHMRRGQPAKITVDAYPDFKLTGKLDSVQPATGEALSIIPAQNATGNWVKIVQRVPVKIVFDRIPDDPDRRLGPGMSAEVSVQVR